MRVFECVPNVSEGRNRATLDACAAAITGAGVVLAHRTSDPVHDRSVFTFFGSGEAVVAAVVALAGVTTESIDLRTQRGAHPRIGALDVVPMVPFGDATLADASALAHVAGRELWRVHRLPSVFYGEAATRAERRSLADVRLGEFEALQTRGHRFGPPDVGEAAIHPSAGAVAVGARPPLIAFNVVLATGDLAVARTIAGMFRERGGGLRTLRVLGIALADGRAQVSCNLTDADATPLHRVTGAIAALAARYGVRVERSELIGLVSRRALAAVAAHVLDGPLPLAPP
ncbi:MAG: glutamate formimidoyltransferase [Vulcanimicrobiaceae bacterium]